MYKFCIDLTQTTCFSFVFLLYRLPESIGKIWKVQIWHNNVGSILCHRADRHDARKGGILYLRDNALTDKQKFEVIVETGFRRGAGTTAKVGGARTVER